MNATAILLAVIFVVSQKIFILSTRQGVLAIRDSDSLPRLLAIWTDRYKVLVVCLLAVIAEIAVHW